MEQFQLERLLGLVVVLLVAVGAVWGLLRATGRRPPTADDLVLGYPPELFPNQRLTRGPALQALVATQTRLLELAQRLPTATPTAQTGELAIWLRVILLELRSVMDTAYRVAIITEVHQRSDHLERLVAEVQHLEARVADDIAHHVVSGIGDASGLDRRLTVLRECAQELTDLARR